MKTAIRFSPLVLLLVLGLAYGQSSRNPNKDREVIVALEQEWLHAHDAATLERILAPDFVHVVPVDLFLKKQQHIDWVVAHPEPKDRHTKFDKLNVRLYGDVGIVNGSVIATDENGKELDRTMFTDVFVFREDRWQAVNAQENQVRPLAEQKH
jgi:ketosteroid isomerase-like protein